MVSFQDINTYSTCIDENEFFKQYYNEDAHFRYDSNFFELTYQPSIREFELIEEMQWVFSKNNDLEHIKFYWPENKGFTPEIVRYFEKNNYELELLELYKINPVEFKPKPLNPSIHVELVNSETLDEFKALSYEADLDFGESFAKPKQKFYDQLFNDPRIDFLIAKIDGEIAGTLTMVHSEKFIELDDVLTAPEHRLNGVATALQYYVMERAKEENKEVILVADGEDTVKEMYQKQGYNYVSYQLGAQKILKEEEMES